MGKQQGEKKLNGTVIVTYRCNARCSMCNRYKAPSKPEEEISIEMIRKLPKMYFTNITGGEPFIRSDLKDIVRELYMKSDRIVISTNGFFTDRIVDLCKEFPQIGIRISIEGLEHTNNEIRGLQNGYQRGYNTLKELREMGMKDVGFGMTVQDMNAPDLVPLYEISAEMSMEFATASLHNSFYFVEAKNIIHDRPMVAKNIENLVNDFLRSNSPKKWFRAYFNHGLINYIYGQKRLLPCDMSFDTFFIDPYADVMPCNGTKDKEVMGNLNIQTWDELWNSPEAEAVRKKVRCCDRDCWMIGSVSPAMHKYIWKPAWWVLAHKFKAFFSKNPYSMYENKICCDYRDGNVSKEQLDRCSTCDLNAAINNGLSEASKEQLVGKTGEEIVDADIAHQTKEKKHFKTDADSNLKDLQTLELENLDTLIKICEKNNLRYYLIGGTLIGVLRHHGFIPWDDDIDVGLPRPDYNRFVKLVANELPDFMDVKTMTSDPNYKCYFTRLINNKQKIYWDHGQYTAKIGVWMDVFPLDGLPDNLLKRRLHVFNVNLHKAIYKFSQINYVTTNKKRPLKERFLIKFAMITQIGKLINPEKSLNSLDKVLQKPDYESTNWTWNFSGCYGKREIVPKLELGGKREAIFEGRRVSIPLKAEEYLEHIYGDWKKLPPSEKRASHPIIFVEEE